jgi:tetratricopeptide (TPR) repeat protein
LALLKEVMAAQLVTEEEADHFAFRHALTQQAIADALLVRERRLLHRTLAEATEQLYVTPPMLDAHLEDLAYHYYEAEAWSKALEYTQRVGEKALALYAPHAAIDHFTHALSALQHLSGTQSPQIYLLLGQAYETLGEFESALSDYEHALEAAHAIHNSEMEWESMTALGFLWTGHDYEQAGMWFRQALGLADKLADPTLRARSLNRLGNWLVNTGRIQEALRLFEGRADRQDMA